MRHFLLLFLLTCGVIGCGENLVPVASPQAEALPALESLHVRRGNSPAIVDARGREVLLRGVNLNSLGDYYQANSAYAPVIPLTDADFSRMAQYARHLA